MKELRVWSLWICMGLCVASALAACGKKGNPEAPGPSNEITYPKLYPTHQN